MKQYRLTDGKAEVVVTIPKAAATVLWFMYGKPWPQWTHRCSVYHDENGNRVTIGGPKPGGES